MTEHDDLIARLRAMGEHPVDPAVASRHLTVMAGATPRAKVRRFGRAKVVAAFAAGLVLGGTSLASAGVMGDTMRDKVADTAQHIGVNLPGGTERVTSENTPGACKVDGNAVTARNHGQYVNQGGDPHDPCGKPLKSADKSPNTNGSENENRSACAPPWAGKGKAGKAIKEQNPNWQPPSTCADTENGTEAPETESDTNETPKANTPPADPGQQGQDKADENKPTTGTPSLTTEQGDQNESSGTVKGNEGQDETPSSTTPDKGNDRQGS